MQLKLPTIVYRHMHSDMMLTYKLHHLQGQPPSHKRTFKEVTKVKLKIKN